MKLSDLKLLNQNYINLRQMIIAAGLDYDRIMKRLQRGSEMITDEEEQKLTREILKIKKVLKKI